MGIDLDPLDLGDEESVRWLEALVWPEEQDRLERLRAAIAIALEEPPPVVRGNLLECLADVAAAAPSDATLVVFHTAVLAYLSAREREQFKALIGDLGAHWISNECADVVPGLPVPRTTPLSPSHFLLAADGRRPLAFCDGHGRWLQWL
jgi:hypothetical protein